MNTQTRVTFFTPANTAFVCQLVTSRKLLTGSSRKLYDTCICGWGKTD